MRTGVRMKLSIVPEPECVRRWKEIFPLCPKERWLHCPIRVNANWVVLLDLNKVITNMQGIKRIHVTSLCLSELWACDMRHFTERIIANTAKPLILGSGQRWLRQRGQESAEEGKMHQRINWKGLSYSD